MTHVATRPPAMEPSPLERAFENYQQMEAELATARAEKQELLALNMRLAAEVQVLRDSYQQADIERTRLQSVASTLLGRLLAINDAIAGAVKDSVRHGIEAVQADADKQETQENTQPPPQHGVTADRLPAPVNWKPN